ncbi:Conserved_hypothetical protein [Hexamita inflata]|uniref:Uncharacterized protein n=1 Tax=Hexamita inflata TaxID=28002 RepID=A0AA86UFK8_9EUKA|nr:Conserved hypothetical protein [Hexamita inflata]
MLWFDRTQCFKDNSITFSLESGKEYMKLNYNPQNCLSRPDDDDLKFTFVQNDEILDTRVLSLATLVSDGNISGLNDYSQSLASYKLDCRESGTLNTDCLNFVTKFIFDDLAKNSQMMQSCFFVTKDGVAYEYFQTIVLYFHIYRPDFNDGCFSQVGLTIFKNMIQLTATPGSLTNCSNAIFEQYFPHTATKSVIGVSATDDHSGTYQKLTKIYNNTFPYGTKLDMFIGCSQFDEPSKCLDTLQAIDNMPDNSSVVMTHYFLAADGSFVQKLSFPVEFTQSLFDQIDVQIFDNEICLIVVIARGFGIQQMLIEQLFQQVCGRRLIELRGLFYVINFVETKQCQACQYFHFANNQQNSRKRLQPFNRQITIFVFNIYQNILFVFQITLFIFYKCVCTLLCHFIHQYAFYNTLDTNDILCTNTHICYYIICS